MGHLSARQALDIDIDIEFSIRNEFSLLGRSLSFFSFSSFCDVNEAKRTVRALGLTGLSESRRRALLRPTDRHVGMGSSLIYSRNEETKSVQLFFGVVFFVNCLVEGQTVLDCLVY